MKKDNEFDKKTGKFFVIFIAIHLVVWTLLCLVRHLLPVDAMEGIVWGSYLDFGTHKHPPLIGWISYLVYGLFGHKDIAIYLIGQICAVIGFIYTYKLGKLFLSRNLAIYSVMILEGCFSYSYMSVFDGFNPNFIIFITFPAIAYHLYRALHRNLLKDWLYLGLFVGISLLAKYQSILIVASILVFIAIYRQHLKCFLNYKLYLSVLTAVLINVPHLLWLIKYDFFSWKYFFLREGASTLIEHFTIPLEFLFVQLAALAGTLVIFGIMYFKYKESSRNINKHDAVYILIMGYLPLLLQSLPSIFTGEKLMTTWGFPMLYITGIVLFYFFPVKTNEESFSLFNKCVYSVMAIIFIFLFTLFSVEKNFRSTYPYETISKNLKVIYKNETGKDLKYVTGYIEFALPLTIYGKMNPQIIFTTYGHKNPWIDDEDVKRNGFMIIARGDDAVYEYTVANAQDYVDKPYSVYYFKIKNKLNQEKEYPLFYKIVMPQK